MLQVHRSNRTDRLVDVLAERLADDPIRDPMVAEQVSVKSRGMERWLSHQLAERLGTRSGRDGVAANIEFPFPGRVIHRVVRACLATEDDVDPWSPDRLAWHILELLPALREVDEFERVDNYLRKGQDFSRRDYGLARRIADLFDRYAMFRPAMVQAWSDGKDVDAGGDPLPPEQRWQPLLWRSLEDRVGGLNLAQRLELTMSTLRNGQEQIAGLPARVAFFGSSAFPPVYVDLLVALGQRVDVSLYVIAPSPSLWSRVASAADTAELAEPRNPLLVSCGRLTRDFQTVLERRCSGYEGADVFDESDAEGDAWNALSRLQLDVLADIDRGGPEPSDTAAASQRIPPVTLDADDRSVQFHACHGPPRQVEILHDALLHLFEGDPSLEPRDVLVMTPDIEAYAPHISAVFGRDRARRSGRASRTPSIPYRIADRTLRKTNEVAGALLAVLDLAPRRAEASEVVDLLSRNPVRRRFGLDEEAVGRIVTWVADSGIRWGIDAEHRAQEGQPAERHHTWRLGLDRLLLGVAMADEDERLIADVVPYDDMEGSDVDLLSRFVHFCDELFTIVDELQRPRTIEEWASELNDVVDRLTDVKDDDRWLVDQVREVVADLVDASRDQGGQPSTKDLSLTAVRAMLEGTSTGWAPSAGYETGAVTFCAMVPMRSIPHRVICLLGMDDGAFPRTIRPARFDLIAADSQLGDRDPRDEDRLMFLEAVLAAKDHLVVTYTGRDMRSNEKRAPAVPVGELLDVLDRSFEPDEDGRAASQRLTAEYPLQAFSPRNFGAGDGTRRRSFDREQLEAAVQLQRGATREWDFFPEQLPDPEGDHDVVELADLRRFFRHPIQWLFTNRLGMWLREEHEEVDDTEPVETDNLGSWAIGDSMLDAFLDDRDLDRWTDAYLSRGTAPAGTLGAYEIDDVRPTVQRIVQQVQMERSASMPDGYEGSHDLPVDVQVAGRRLLGVLGGIHDGVLLQPQYSSLKAKHRLELWIRHLALAVAYPGHNVQCLVVGRDGDQAVTCSFRSLDAPTAEGILGDLFELYDRGRREPLPLFETSSEAYSAVVYEALLGAGPEEEARLAAIETAREGAVKEARGEWEENDLGWGGDRVDVHVAQCYGDGCEFETILAKTDFEQVALEVWLPLLEHEVQL